MRACTIVLFLCLAYAETFAQQNSALENRSSRGRDFYMSFMPNVHDRRTGGLTDTLYIYVTSETPTSGRITYRNRLRQVVTQDFRIDDPNQMYVHRIHFQDVELLGYFQGGGFPINFAASQSERVAPQYVRVTAEDDVTVYALNQAFFTSDAFLALPVTSLGTEYVVMAYKSDARGQNFTGNERDETSTPSQFVVVATQDNTDIIVQPSAPTLVNRTTQELRARLNEGESFLVQADPRAGDGLADLTGSRVISSKPVAVFGGHQRAALPVELKPLLSSRDYLIEQMPGLETWGRQSFITPLNRSSNETETGNDLYRVLAAYDNTRVLLNGQPLVTLNAGEHFEAPLTQPGTLTASDVILVALLKKTSGAGNLVGDPFMLLVPTVEQYDRSYRFINAEAFDRNLPAVVGSQVFSEHFVTLVVPSVAIGSVRLDEQPVPAASFRAIPGSPYSFANISVRGGVHTARADSAFGVYVYGYGIMNSYGYVGGGRLRIIAPDRTPPRLVLREECFAVEGVLYDTLLTDKGVASVRLEGATNVETEIEPFTPPSDSVRFRARLQNRFQDGELTVEARDGADLLTRRRILIPGLTVGLESARENPQTLQIAESMPAGASRIFRFSIINYGATAQTVSALTLNNAPQNAAQFRLLAPQTPLTLQPGARDTILVALDAPAESGVFLATLALETPLCGARELAALSVRTGEDLSAPTFTAERDACARVVRVLVRDAEPFPSGIASLEILGDLVNCSLTIEPPPAPFDAVSTKEIVIRILNPRLDAIFAIAATDSAGNRAVLRDTVQGFTIQIVRAVTERGATGEWGDTPITALDCRDVEIRNFGILPYSIGRITPSVNRWFSVSESQFPIVIPPQTSGFLRLCFAPLEAISYADLLTIEGYCEEERLNLTGRGEPILRIIGSRCAADIQLRTSRAPLQYFMEQNFPNPAGGAQTTVRIGLPEPSPVTLTVVSPLGGEIARLDLGTLGAGEHDITLDISAIPAGTYFYRIQTPQMQIARQMIISR
jgi:hypothetical protein